MSTDAEACGWCLEEVRGLNAMKRLTPASVANGGNVVTLGCLHSMHAECFSKLCVQQLRDADIAAVVHGRCPICKAHFDVPSSMDEVVMHYKEVEERVHELEPLLKEARVAKGKAEAKAEALECQLRALERSELRFKTRLMKSLSERDKRNRERDVRRSESYSCHECGALMRINPDSADSEFSLDSIEFNADAARMY